jgi:hypothetical protein
MSDLRPEKIRKEKWLVTALHDDPAILTSLGMDAFQPFPHGTQADWLLHQDSTFRFLGKAKRRTLALRIREAAALRYGQFTITEGSESQDIAAEFYLECWGDEGQPLQAAILIDLTKFIDQGLVGHPDRRKYGGGSSGRQHFLCYNFNKLYAAGAVRAAWMRPTCSAY